MAELALEPPRAQLAMIGGAVTRALRFPEDLSDPDVEVVATGDVLEQAPLPPGCGCATYVTPRPPSVIGYADR